MFLFNVNIEVLIIEFSLRPNSNMQSIFVTSYSKSGYFKFVSRKENLSKFYKDNILAENDDISINYGGVDKPTKKRRAKWENDIKIV